MEFDLFIAEVEKLLENKHCEEYQRIDLHAPRIALDLLNIALIKK